MSSIKARLTTWQEKRKAAKALKILHRDMALFNRLFKDERSNMANILQEAAFKSATDMFMKMLTAEGFSHCFYCPRRSPLRNHPISDGVMLCEIHYQLVVNNPTKNTGGENGKPAAEATREGSTKTTEGNVPPSFKGDGRDGSVLPPEIIRPNAHRRTSAG